MVVALSYRAVEGDQSSSIDHGQGVRGHDLPSFICRPLTLLCDRRRLAPMSTDDSVNILLIDGIDKDRQYYAQRLTVISPDYQILEAANGRARGLRRP